MAQNKKKKKKSPKSGTTAFRKLQPELFSDQFHTTTPFYRKNMEALRNHYPKLAEQISHYPFTGSYRVEASARLDGTPNLYCVEGGFYYYDNQDPILDAKKQLETLQLNNAKMALCLGIGLGFELVHFAIDFSEQTNTQVLLVIEKDLELFKLACCYSDLSKLLVKPNVFFLIGCQQDQLYVPLKSAIKTNSWYLFLRAFKPFYHLSSLRLAKNYYLAAIRNVNEAAVHSVVDFGNCPEDSLIGIENMLANMSVIVRNPGIDRLFGAFSGKPAIVAATGPSLNKNKHLLKSLDKKALLLCPDASLPILLDIGVRPHLVTSLERVIATSTFFENLSPEQLTETYLAACPVVRKETYDLFHGPKVIVYRNLDHFKWLEIERGILDIKASSGNMAFKIAAAMGCDPIILIGQDLAFSREGATHAAGNIFGEKQEGMLHDILTVQGNDGQPIQTNSTLYSFLKGYEVDVAEYSGDCVNATEGGAYIQGTKVMPLAEAIDRYLNDEYHPLNTLQSHLAPPDEAATIKTAEQLMANIDRTVGELAKINQLCRDGLAYLDGAAPGLNGSSQAQAQSVLSKVHTYKNQCRADHHTYQLFFTHVIQSFTIKFEMSLHAIPDTHPQPAAAIAETALRHREWFETISKLANVCGDTLQKYRELLYFDFY
ncbi:MAG: DUF115 domain-containing protein [Peptococcaceae bacterium]|nr:DUF115 domain-containing protein [Peptococcaceae bacterium]